MANFKIKGSGEKEYRVHIAPKGNDSVTITCDCKAGIFGRMCKHKLAVATGDPSLLIDNSEADKLEEVAEKISRRNIGKLLLDLAETKKEQEAAKRKMDRARKALEKAMKG
jgi:hypothetical protein